MVMLIDKDLADWAVAHRRYLHANPELSGQEFQTCAYIRKCLEELNIEILHYELPNLVGYLKGTEGKKTIALRADIDALPIVEEGDKPYISKVPGVAHVCGHDGHTAVLLAVAKWMSENREAIKHNIIFLFQSSEEMSPSGAEALVRQGAIDKADAVFGLHLMQSLEKGKIGYAYGPMLASSDDFRIVIKGKGGHGSAPQDTIDPTYIAGHILLGLQSIVSRRISPVQPAVISVGQLTAGSNYNIIPNEAFITGTIRTFSEETRQFIFGEMKKLSEGICATFGAQAEVSYILGTPPLVNDKEMSRFAEGVVRECYGDEVAVEVEPVMGAEDFSFYVQKRPGAYLLVGMGGEKSAYPHHHPRFDIDEEEIGTAIDLFLQLVKRFE
jgi:amidohydrolase